MVKKKFWQERGNGQFLGWGGNDDGFDDPAVWSLWVLYVLPMGREEYRDGTKLHGSSAIEEWSCLPNRPAFDQSAP
jgi:hypothetical protein